MIRDSRAKGLCMEIKGELLQCEKCKEKCTPTALIHSLMNKKRSNDSKLSKIS